MRNLLQYPITQAEMLAALDDAIQIVPPRGIGDVRHVALIEVRKLIASGTEARRVETGTGSIHDGPAPKGDAQP